MTIEQKLQDYILDKYKSVMQFAKLVDLPYTTVKGILVGAFGEHLFKMSPRYVIFYLLI